MPDPASSAAYDRYAYVNNNPINFNDPSGHRPCDEEFGCSNNLPLSSQTTHTGLSDSSNAIYWGGLSESQLASYQQIQNGNTCALNAIAAGYNLLGSSLPLNGNELGDITSKKGLIYRMSPNGGTLPFEQVNTINNMSSLTGIMEIPVDAYIAGNHKLNDYTKYLSDNKKVVLYTIYWSQRSASEIWNIDKVTYDNSKLLNGHTMVFVAYDPTHEDSNGHILAYGFINSWGASGLSWMSESDVSSVTDAIVIMTNHH